MPSRPKGPKIEADRDHAAVVSIFSRLHSNDIEYFFFRVVKDRTTTIMLRELAYWFDRASKNPDYPRAKIFREGFYWVSRTKVEWHKAHGIERKEVERAYEQARELLYHKNFKFRSVPTTHWRFLFANLLHRLENDPIIRERLGGTAAEETADGVCENAPPPARAERVGCSGSSLTADNSECTTSNRETDISECTESAGGGSQAHIQSSSQSNQTTTSTGYAGPADAGGFGHSPSAQSGATAPEPPPPARSASNEFPSEIPASSITEQEDQELGQEEAVSTQPVPAKKTRAILQAAQGLSPNEQLTRLRPYGGVAKLALGYLLIWQALFEKEYHSRRVSFSDRDLSR